MQSLEDYLADYERFHTNRVNLITHYVGIPCILIAVIMLLNWFSIAFASAYSISFTWLAWIVVSYFYVRLSLKLGGLAALILLVLALVIWLLSGHAPTKTTLIIFLILFIGGWIADRLGRRGIGLLDVMYSLLLIFFIAQIPIIFGWTLITPVVWLLFAAGGQWGMLCYPWLAAYFGKDLSSRAQTGVNMGIFVFAFLAQYLFGEIINLFKPSVNGGYSPDAYQVCFAIAFVCEIAALIWFISGRKMLNARYRAKTLV